MKAINIRLQPDEYEAIQQAAALEYLQVATFLRKLALERAAEQGIVTKGEKQLRANIDALKNADPTKKPRGWKRAPRFLDDENMINGTKWNNDILNAHEAGQTISDIAFDYNITPQLVRTKLASAKEFRECGGEVFETINPTANPSTPTHSTATQNVPPKSLIVDEYDGGDEDDEYTEDVEDADGRTLDEDQGDDEYLHSLDIGKDDTPQEMERKNKEKLEYLAKKHGWVI